LKLEQPVVFVGHVVAGFVAAGAGFRPARDIERAVGGVIAVPADVLPRAADGEVPFAIELFIEFKQP